MSDVQEMDTAMSTSLAVLPSSAVSVIVNADKDNILAKLAARVADHKPDVSTSKGRAEIRTLAADIASDKMTLIRLGKGLTEGWRKQTAAVNAECKLIEDRMDALKEQIRRPLTEYENVEKARVAGHEAALARMQELASTSDSDSAVGLIDTRMEDLARAYQRDWQHDFAARASDVYDDCLDRLRQQRERAVRREAEAAELARLRAAAEEHARQEAVRAQAEREARIAAEAADRARRDAEAKAERERQETLRAAAEERARVEREAQAAQRRVEAERQAAHDRAEAAERRRIADAAAAKEREEAAARKAETDRAAAEQKAKREQEAAIAAERQRQEDERARVEREAEAMRREAERKAANLEHRRKVNALVIKALSLCNLSEAQAKSVVEAIVRGQVPHVSLDYRA